ALSLSGVLGALGEPAGVVDGAAGPVDGGGSAAALPAVGTAAGAPEPLSAASSAVRLAPKPPRQPRFAAGAVAGPSGAARPPPPPPALHDQDATSAPTNSNLITSTMTTGRKEIERRLA